MKKNVIHGAMIVMAVACGPKAPKVIVPDQGGGMGSAVLDVPPDEAGYDILEPVLIGSAPDGRDPRIDEPWKQQDGNLYVIMDSPYQIYTGAGTYLHVAAWDDQWEAAAGARVFVDQGEVGKMDDHGTLVFNYIPNADDGSGGHSVWVVLDRGGKKLVGSVYFAANRRTESFETQNLFVYTDRGVYNPGQTVKIRAIAWTLRGEFKPIANDQVEILLKNDRSRVVGGGAQETDEWGVLDFEIPLPLHAPEGNYTLEANFKQASESAKIRIERFVPPVIQIEHDLGRFLTKDQKTLPFEVKLGYYGGGTFESGKIEVKVKAQGAVVHEQAMDATGTGPFKLVIDEAALGKIRAKLYENDNVQVEIKVTDKFGREDSIKRDMRFVINPYVAVIITDKESYGPGDPVLVSVRIKDLDDVPVRDKEVKCVIGGESMKAETDKDGVAEFHTKMGNTTMGVEAYMEGVSNAIAYSSLYYRETPPMLSEIPGGKVGEREKTRIVVRFPGGITPAEEVVHADVTDSSGSLVYGFLIPVKQSGKEFTAETEFPAPSWGSMLITLYCLARSGEDVGILADGQKLEVAPRKTLEIVMGDVPANARPGDTVKVEAAVKTAAGEDAEASVGASIVDDAVLSLLDPLEITPMDRFYNPELKVLSTTGATTLTWPVVSRNWGSSTYDIAWCNWGYRSGGPLYNSGSPSGGSYGYGGGGIGGGGGGGGYGYGAMGDTGADYYYEAPAMEQSLAYPSSPTPVQAPPPPPAKSASTKSEAEYSFSDDQISGELLKPDGAAWSGKKAADKSSLDSKQETQGDVVITIRTNFAETSLWLPHLSTEKGKISFEATLPDSITTQRVTLVASDKKGGSGVEHHEIVVGQDIYARSDLPAVLTVGDSLVVQAALRNLTKGKVKGTLALKSDAMEVIGQSSTKVEAGPDGTAVVKFLVKPLRAGEAKYMISAEGKGFKDIMERSVYVRPAGTPAASEVKGTLDGKKPFEASFDLTGKEAYAVSFVHVSFPGAVPIIQGLEAILDEPQGCIDYVASRALVAASVYRYLQAYGQDEASLARVGQALTLSMAAVLMSQRDDGGWGWNVNLLRDTETGTPAVVKMQSNPYMTAQSLEALLEMKAAGLPVPPDAVSRALDSLATTMDSDGLWDISAISFWEGKSDKVKLGTAAEIFKVMAYAGVVFPDATYSAYGYQNAMTKLGPTFTAAIGDPSVDPFTLANASLGLLYMGKFQQGSISKDLEEKMDASIKKLLTMRKEAYWEPGWFSAWGGMMETTQAALELMVKVDAAAYDGEIRSSINYILSTQSSFGDWHNARGTASAIRALLLVPPTAPEKPSTVEISVNGELVKKVEIDPEDPYLSAVALRMVEITQFLEKGKNKVTVTYDGNLKAPVALRTEVWGSGEATVAALPDAPRITVSRTYAATTVSKGAPVAVRLKMAIEDRKEPFMVLEPLPSNSSVEVASLDKLVMDGTIVDYFVTGDAIAMFVNPTAAILEISYRLTGDRPGLSVQPPTEIALVRSPRSPAYGVKGLLTVQ